PIPYPQVPATMSKAVFNPVMYRPLFECLDMVTCRTFETPAAGTIPLFLLEPEYVREVYGDRATQLMLGTEKPEDKILDVLSRPDHYAEIVRDIRREFGQRHSPEVRLRELIRIVQE
ncbi:MAG TPA: glycosyltransferase, partial [Hyphomicrobiaceae bacterium]|nr:glycosyltransferase [Hyphomicrobiaceae bacterium]